MTTHGFNMDWPRKFWRIDSNDIHGASSDDAFSEDIGAENAIEGAGNSISPAITRSKGCSANIFAARRK
ncbi:hypothetical protein CCP2SC5_450008 [Azospirillaceae bacterium]